MKLNKAIENKVIIIIFKLKANFELKKAIKIYFNKLI